jgi:lipoyl(octanoyl) transferase
MKRGILPLFSIPRFAYLGPMVQITHLPGLAPYAETLAAMEARAEAIAKGAAPEALWFLEHPPLYTAGTSARPADLVDPDRFPVFPAGRGGQYTYHGPGQRVVYVMLDLGRRGRDVRQFVCALEAWVIGTLAQFNVKGERRAGRVGVWVTREGHEDKIAAIGIRLRRWVSFHGISINVEPDLSHFTGIVPCGISDHGVTSLVDLGLPVTLADLDAALLAEFPKHFPSLGSAPDATNSQCAV